jgi:Tfp pilus assembly protein PilN
MLEQYYRINEATGVSINLLPDGSLRMDCCSVSVKDNQLEILKKQTGLSSAEELGRQLPEKTYIALNLYGKGILHKQVENVGQIDQQNFSQVMPNATFADFYIQQFNSGSRSFISVIRKTEADRWIGQLRQYGLIPVSLSLGPFPVEQVMGQLNFYDADVHFDGHVIKRDEQQQWSAYQYQEGATPAFAIKIATELIDEKLVLPYAAAFQLVLADRVTPLQAGVPALSAVYENVVSQKKFRVKGFLILAVFFVLLLVNFLALSFLNTSNNQLTEQVSRFTQSSSDMEGINDKIKDKEALLHNLGWDGGINKSILVDQLAGLLPAEVSWKEIVINPVDNTVSRVQKTLQFKDRQLRILGISQKIIPVNEWIARCRALKWVKDTQLDSYTYNTELNTGQFTVIITY